MANILIGAGADDSGSTNHNSNYFYLTKYPAVASGNVDQIKMKASANADVKVGIYSDNAGAPNALLNSTTGSVVSGWNDIEFPSTAVVSGTDYWLAFILSYVGGCVYGATGVLRYKSFSWANDLPDPAGTGFSSGNLRSLIAGWSVYSGIPKVKSFNGVLMASAKTVNGIAVASIKSVQGIS